jgi:hypothetical protein
VAPISWPCLPYTIFSSLSEASKSNISVCCGVFGWSGCLGCKSLWETAGITLKSFPLGRGDSGDLITGTLPEYVLFANVRGEPEPDASEEAKPTRESALRTAPLSLPVTRLVIEMSDTSLTLRVGESMEPG